MRSPRPATSHLPPESPPLPPHNFSHTAPLAPLHAADCPRPPSPLLRKAAPSRSQRLPHGLRSLPLPATTPQPPHPTPVATSASNKKSFHPPETAVSPHRSIHTPAPAPPPAPPPHEIPAT